jgi:hypothetical protein
MGKKRKKGNKRQRKKTCCLYMKFSPYNNVIQKAGSSTELGDKGRGKRVVNINFVVGGMR